MRQEDDRRGFKVVRNHEEQFSIWPTQRSNAPGWWDAGFSGTQSECLDYIRTVWVDMRPLSLRKELGGSS
jgi:MbtH protein